MAFQVSPGVNVSEVDLTAVIPAVSTSVGAVTGMFRWGPVSKRVLISSEDDLVGEFFKPDSNNFGEFFTAANFLSYSNALQVVRVTTSLANNAATTTAKQIKNEEDYTDNHVGTSPTSGVSGAGDWIARYPGALGNSLKVVICPRPDAFSRTLSGTVAITANTKTVTGTSTKFTTQLVVGDFLYVGGQFNRVVTITNATSVTLLDRQVSAATSATAQKRFRYFSSFENGPDTSKYANTVSASLDEIHVAVVDEDGTITGVPDTVIEVYPHVSLASDAKAEDGSSNYYRDVINAKSKWIWWANVPASLTNAGSAAAGLTFGGVANNAITSSLTGGTDGAVPSNANIQAGLDLLRDSDEVDVSFIMMGNSNQTNITYAINSIAEVRKDCLVCFSPLRGNVVDNLGAEATDIVTFRNLLPSTSFAVMDSGWKYQYDKYNDIYRYVPLNGDIAGLMAQTDRDRDPWFSPAGYNRGNVKNVVRLAYNPSRKADRDLLYGKSVNPVVTFPGQGTVLFGDRTLLSKASAFDRINVRRLFIVLEKAISQASKFSLFEFNDEITRGQFVNLVEPFLRDVQGRSGIYDFRVVCDETNNTSQVIDSNQFVGDIYIKPARSINYIQLNFVAVRTGVDFTEIVGKA